MSVRELPTAAVMEAEEDVLGAILSAGSYGVEVGHSTLDRAVATGLEVATSTAQVSGRSSSAW